MRDPIPSFPRHAAKRIAHLAVLVAILGGLHLLLAPPGAAQDDPGSFVVEPYTLQQHRIIPHSGKVRGWAVTPSHVLNNQFDTVWLAE